MSYSLIPSADYKAACDAIRAKTGKTDLIKSGDMATEIANIQSSCEPDVAPAYFSYHGLVIPDNDWDSTEYPYALLTTSSDNVISFIASTTMLGSKKGLISSFAPKVLVTAPFVTSVFDPMTQTWGTFELTSTGTKTVENYYAIWANADALPLDDGRVSIYKSTRVPVYYDPHKPTAYAYSDGTMTFQSHGFPNGSKTVIGTFIDWDTIDYNDGDKKIGLDNIPWGHLKTLITSVTINEDVSAHSVREWFDGFSSLTSINRLPNGITELNYTFNGCTVLPRVTIPSTVTLIDNKAFADCEAMTSIEIPSTVTKIGFGAFSGCGITSLTIPNGVTELGDQMCRFCNSLVNVVIPASVTKIGYWAFGSNSLTSVKFEDPNGWSVVPDSDTESTVGTPVDVSNASTAASLLTGDYCKYYWYKN